jgi:hypothetical protein
LTTPSPSHKLEVSSKRLEKRGKKMELETKTCEYCEKEMLEDNEGEFTCESNCEAKAYEEQYDTLAEAFGY